MPSTSTRRPGPATARPRPRRSVGRGFPTAPPTPVRPVTAPFAAVFGLLVAVEDGYLGWLLWNADPDRGWYLLLPGVLAVGALTGAVLVLRGAPLGRWASGSAVLAVAEHPAFGPPAGSHREPASGGGQEGPFGAGRPDRGVGAGAAAAGSAVDPAPAPGGVVEGIRAPAPLASRR